MKKTPILILLALLFLVFSITRPGRAAPPIDLYDLRYTLKIDTNDPCQVKMAWDHCHAVATLQGIVNRRSPQLYILFVDSQRKRGTNIDQYWLDKLRIPGGWLADRPLRRIETIEQLVETYRDRIKGAVVYDPRVPATSNLASTIAGVEDLIAVRYDPTARSLYHRLIVTGPKLPVKIRLLRSDGNSLFTGKGRIPDIDIPSTGSAKCDAYLWMKYKYLDTGRCDGSYGAYYIDSYWLRKPRATVLNHHTLTNHDFFVSKRAFFFDLSPWADEPATDDPDQPAGADRNTLLALLGSAYEHGGREKMIHIGGFPAWATKYTKHASGRHDDVPTEWEYTKIIAAYNGFQDADAIGYGAIANASFYAHFPLQKEYPQRWVTKEELFRRGYLTSRREVKIDGREFVIFYVGDYDASGWVYQRIMDLWDHPDRGKVPLMWCISPVLARRIPHALHYQRMTATENDYFAAADNGAGYLNPGLLQEPRPISNLPSGLEAWGRHCTPFYQQWGMTITGFIIDGYAPGLNEKGLDCYARFSPNGIVPQKIPLTLLHGRMPVLRADYDVNQGNPDDAVKVILERIKKRPIPFHWFRNILKSPAWYVQIHQKLKAADPHIELLDGPTFFELYCIWLQQNPDGAAGKIR